MSFTNKQKKDFALMIKEKGFRVIKKESRLVGKERRYFYDLKCQKCGEVKTLRVDNIKNSKCKKCNIINKKEEKIQQLQQEIKGLKNG